MPAVASSVCAHPLSVAPLVRLSARRPHGGTAAAVQQLELNAGRINRPAHEAVERVDLPDQMALRRAADRRIARHQRHGLFRQRADRHVQPAPAGRPGRLNARMPRADDDDVVLHLPSAFSPRVIRTRTLDPDPGPWTAGPISLYRTSRKCARANRRSCVTRPLPRAHAAPRADRPARSPPAGREGASSAASARAERGLRARDQVEMPHVGDEGHFFSARRRSCRRSNGPCKIVQALTGARGDGDASDVGRAPGRREIALVGRDDACGRPRVEQRSIVGVERAAGVEDDDRHRRRRRGRLRAADTFRLDLVARQSHPGRVDDRRAQPVEVYDFRQHVTGRAWRRRDDGAVAADKTVEEARLAGVRPADQRDGDALANQPPASSRSEPAAAASTAATPPSPPLHRPRRSDSPLRGNRARLPAARSGRTAARARRASRRASWPSSCSDAARACSGVADSIRSATASACVRSIRPPRYARRVNSPGRASRAPVAMHASISGPQHDRAPVRADLDDVLCGVRMRRGKPGGDHLVRDFDRTLFAAKRRNGRAPGLQRCLPLQHFLRDGQRGWPTHAHDAQPASARRRGQRDDRVVSQQR